MESCNDCLEETNGQREVEEPMLRFFRYAHLPEILREVSKRFSQLAHHLAVNLPRSPERTVALRKLLESKDAAVRAALPTPIAVPTE